MTPFALVVALLVVGLNTWFAIAAVRSLVESEAWLAHTWEVVGQTEHLMLTVTSAESATRSYVVTGLDSSLMNLKDALRTLPQNTQHFQLLTLDNPLQQANIQELRILVERRMSILQESVRARQAGGFEQAQALAMTGNGAAEMDQIRQVIARMDIEEQHLLVNRAEEARHNGYRALFAVSLAAVLDLLMIGLVTYYFVQERKQRVHLEVAAERLSTARTEAERYAEEVHVLNVQLEDRVRQRTAELEATNRELEAFSYSVSHDLRAPLRTIDGFSLALQEDYADAVDATGRDYIGRVRTGVQRMGQLIDALLQLSRITRADITREPLDVVLLAGSVAATLRDENPDRQIHFEITPGPEANADPKLVQVALENLLGNAVKFTSRRMDAEICFGWDAEKNAWRISDNGAGFDMHYADKLFNAFNRLHGDRDFKGSGIGLATVARVIRRHGGRIWADSTVDHGATFWFTLG